MATLLGVVKHAGREALEEGGERVARNFPRPPATNPSLDRTMQQLFRAEDQYLGGTAEAIRRGDGHIIKGKERVRRLEKILRREPLGDADRATANRVRNDLIDALKSQGEWPR